MMSYSIKLEGGSDTYDKAVRLASNAGISHFYEILDGETFIFMVLLPVNDINEVKSHELVKALKDLKNEAIINKI